MMSLLLTLQGISVGEKVTVLAREDGASCGIGFISVDTRLQVWLSENETTSSCTRTTTDFDRNRAELEKLSNNSS
jgi:hypothetical protein